MNNRIIPILIVIVLSGCVAKPNCNPALVNLQENLNAVDVYYSDGAYEEDIKAIVMDADIYLTKTLNLMRHDKPAIIFDIDDTLLSNIQIYQRMNYRFRSTAWQQWVNRAQIPAIPPVQSLFMKFKDKADIFIITGRNVLQRAQTMRNLEHVGYSGWKTIFFKEAWDRELNAEQFKTKIINQLIVSEGYQVIANFGDQESDFKASIQGRNFKLPNYLYVTQ